jgi:UDP-glucose 4-epimerase
MAQCGAIETLDIMGDDYPTPDGTCIRDYIHVDDPTEAHIKASAYLQGGGDSDFFNLETGHGVSVREVIETAARITGKLVHYRIGPRRVGDPAILNANAIKARQILGWTAGNSDMANLL